MKHKTIIFLFSLFLMLSLGGLERVSACSCIKGRPACEAFGNSKAVFVGKVTGAKEQITTDYDDAKETWDVGEIYFEVKEAFSGVKKNSRVTIRSGTGGGDCGYWFKRGETYLIYGYGDETKGFTTNICTRTRLVSEASEDLTFLRSLPPVSSGARIYGKVIEAVRNPEEEGWRQQKPLPEVKLKIQQTDGKRRSYKTTTDAQGDFEVSGVPAGKYKITPALPKNTKVSEYETEEFEVGDRGCIEREFWVQNDSLITGKVIDENGRAVSDIWVDLIPAAQKEKQPNRTDQTLTDDNGEFEFETVPSGQYILAVNYIYPPEEDRPYATTFYPNTIEKANAIILEIGAGQKVTEIEFRLPPRLVEASVQGAVFWEDGTPAKEIEVYLEDFERLGACTDVKGCFLKTDSQGNFVLHGFVGRKYRINASGKKKIDGKETELFAELPTFIMSGSVAPFKMILNLTQDPAKRDAP